jgi:tetratricopeptide (TPR) repeat protein
MAENEDDLLHDEESWVGGLRHAFREAGLRRKEHESVLDALERTTGVRSRVTLRETDPPPPTSPATFFLEAHEGRYLVTGELSRGGVGVVLLSLDQDLGRDVALKVLRREHLHRDGVVRRFVEEAQIGGQLEHPGIVPVYDLGLTSGDRPFFAMKLIRGEPLSELLEERESPEEDLRRFLGVFLRVCQTVAYAHSRGVIHRDLKPENVMVGAFGEVQVIDWGLAKVCGGIEPTETGEPEAPPEIRTNGEARTVAGMVMGTVPYMPPEQARGRVGEIDERSDVFSLGGVLLEILTGEPPYPQGPSRALALAAKGDLRRARERLETCTAPAELKALCARCLSPAREDRPADAGAFAAEVEALLAADEEAARRAEVTAARERARTEAERALERREAHRAEWERRARRRSRALAAILVLTVVLGACGYLLKDRADQRERERAEREVATLLREAGRLESEGEIEKAAARARRALDRAEVAAAPEAVRGRARATFERLGAEIERREALERMRREDAALLSRVDEQSVAQRTLKLTDRLEPSTGTAGYAEAFLDIGIDLDTLCVEEAAEAIRSRTKSVELAAILDRWGRFEFCSGNHQKGIDLFEVARSVDPDPWRNRFRDLVVSHDWRMSREILDELELSEISATTANLLAEFLHHHPASGERSLKLYRRVRRRFPRDFWSNLSLAWIDSGGSPHRLEESARCLVTALALRPKEASVWCDLTRVLRLLGLKREARIACRKAFDLDPDGSLPHYEFAHVLLFEGRLEESVVSIKKSIEIEPSPASYSSLGGTLMLLERHQEAVEAFRAGCRRSLETWGYYDPECKTIHWYQPMGHALVEAGEYQEAVKILRRGCANWPGLPGLRQELGQALLLIGRTEEAITVLRKAVELKRESPVGHALLGRALARAGRPTKALPHLEEAVSIAPTAEHLCDLGSVLVALGRHEAGVAACRRAIELDAGDPRPYYYIGRAHIARDRFEEALVALEKALELGGENAVLSDALGRALWALGDTERALQHLRQAATLEPENVHYQIFLGSVLCDTGDYAGAVEPLTKAIELQQGDDTNTRLALTIALAHLDRNEEASKHLAVCRSRVDRRGVESEFQRDLLAEAEALLREGGK